MTKYIKISLFSVSAIVFSLISCKTKKIEGNYKSYYQKSYQEHGLKGSVYKSRKLTTFYKVDSLRKNNSIYKYLAPNRFSSFGYAGFHEFDKYGLVIKRHRLKDSIMQTLATDTTEIRNKNWYGGGVIRFWSYEHFSKDIQKKVRYTQNLPIRKYVFNPHRVYFNNRTYKPYHTIVKKDSSYRKQTRAFEYKLNANNTIHQEILKTLWDNDLDGKTDEETTNTIVTYHYNEKDQLIKKVFDFVGFSSFPDHDLDFSGTALFGTKEVPQEEYTYDEAGNLTSVYTYVYQYGEKNGVVFSEDYRYDANNNNLISKLRRAAGGGSMNRDYRRTNELFFNEKEELIKAIAYKDNEKDIHAIYRFEYSGHDAYDNWTKCYHYLNDEKKPYGETNRILEYYKE